MVFLAAVLVLICTAAVFSAVNFFISIDLHPSNMESMIFVNSASTGIMPEKYRAMNVKILAVEHTVERTNIGDMHLVDALVLNTGTDGIFGIEMWQSTDTFNKLPNCGNAETRTSLSPNVPTSMHGCFVLPFDEKPKAIFIVDKFGPSFVWDDKYGITFFPLFDSIVPSYMTCETNLNGTVCLAD